MSTSPSLLVAASGSAALTSGSDVSIALDASQNHLASASGVGTESLSAWLWPLVLIVVVVSAVYLYYHRRSSKNTVIK